MSLADKTTAQNTLLLGAIGDALGAPVEFKGARIIERTYGVEPPEELAFAGPAPARFTDDTQMTLFMAEGLGVLWRRVWRVNGRRFGGRWRGRLCIGWRRRISGSSRLLGIR